MFFSPRKTIERLQIVAAATRFMIYAAVSAGLIGTTIAQEVPPLKDVSKHLGKIVVPHMFSLDVRLLTGDVNVGQQWGDAKVIYQPESLGFRFQALKPGATAAEWQLSATPFASVSPQVAANKLLATGAAGAVPSSGFRTFAIGMAEFLAPAPPAAPVHYYVRVVGRDANNSYVGSASEAVTITYRQDSSHTAFTEIGVLGVPQIDKVTGPWEILDAGKRPILVAKMPFSIAGRNFPKNKVNLEIRLLRDDEIAGTFAPDAVSGTGNNMIVEATLPAGIGRGFHQLQLAVVQYGKTIYKPTTVVSLASPIDTPIRIALMSAKQFINFGESYVVLYVADTTGGKVSANAIATPTFDLESGQKMATNFRVWGHFGQKAPVPIEVDNLIILATHVIHRDSVPHVVVNDLNTVHAKLQQYLDAGLTRQQIINHLRNDVWVALDKSVRLTTDGDPDTPKQLLADQENELRLSRKEHLWVLAGAILSPQRMLDRIWLTYEIKSE